MTERGVRYEKFVITTKVDEDIIPVVLPPIPQLAHVIFKPILLIPDKSVEVTTHEHNVFAGSDIHGVLGFRNNSTAFWSLGRVLGVNMNNAMLGKDPFRGMMIIRPETVWATRRDCLAHLQ